MARKRMTAVEVAGLIMEEFDESDMENEQNDDCDGDAASIFYKSTAN